MKRTALPDGLEPKRRALGQLATPPTSPEKNSVIDISATINGHGKKLAFSDSVYSKAKALFQRGANASESQSRVLVGRENEAARFEKFLESSIRTKSCASLYISGPPGTGKTAQVNTTLDYLSSRKQGDVSEIYDSRVQIMRVNCMAIASPENIFHEICCFVGDHQGRKKSFDDLYSHLLKATDADVLVVVLDEMDRLITKDQQVLFQLFHCASQAKTAIFLKKLVLIGIANALDLTDKFLPRLRSNGFNPYAMNFTPYSADQIKLVITSKLLKLAESEKENALAGSIMHPGAIQLCCRKCASVTGDLRKAFDICYKSIELVEQRAQATQKSPQVLIGDVAKVCSQTFGDNFLSRVKGLNLLQKAVLCCLYNHEQNNRGPPPTVNELFVFYLKHTAYVLDNLFGKLRKGEFLEIVSALESASTIVLSAQSKACTSYVDVGNKGIRLNVLEDDILKGIDDNSALRRLMRNSSP